MLSTLRKYEDGNEALAEALNGIKDLKSQMDNKNEHIEDLINVINKLEMLNSYQEVEILALRYKLGDLQSICGIHARADKLLEYLTILNIFFYVATERNWEYRRMNQYLSRML